MSNTIGGALDQLEGLSRNFQQQVTVIEELTRNIDANLGNTYWEGPAAEKFKAAWEGEFKRALANLQGSLQEAGQEVSRRREALIQAGS